MRSSTDPRAGAGRVPLFCLVSCVQRFPHPSCELRQFSLVLTGARVPVVRHRSPCGGGNRKPGVCTERVSAEAMGRVSEKSVRSWCPQPVQGQCPSQCPSQCQSVSVEVSAQVNGSRWKPVLKSQCSSQSSGLPYTPLPLHQPLRSEEPPALPCSDFPLPCRNPPLSRRWPFPSPGASLTVGWLRVGERRGAGAGVGER